MLRPIQIIRLLQIHYTLMRYAITRPVLEGQSRWLRTLSYLNPFSFLKQSKTRGESIRLGLESLGPIFVKFGQILSTRKDLLPDDIISELSKLQDQVPPFSGKQSIKAIERSMGCLLKDVFVEFDEKPLASASIAQVHAAKLYDNSEVIVKVLRPNIKKIIQNDIALLYFVARLTERLWSQGWRLRPIELVAEFEQTLLGELDLVCEAANASQLRRNFIDSPIMYVPKVYWPYTRSDVMVMERIHGIPIANTEELIAKNTNMKKLAEHGVTIFFTQVFRDGFFHADMHPGNLFVDVSDPENPRYLGVDFGIMGTLSTEDQHYLAENILAFFHRDYRRIALLHIESGWVSPHTRVDQFESAIRAVSEPIFERPLADISFGQLLLKLFQTAGRYNMVVQPQLMLLQKTLFNIEGLGRRLYPDLDLWETAKPFMEDWATQQKGPKKILKTVIQEWQNITETALKTPQLVYDILRHIQRRHHEQAKPLFHPEKRKRRRKNHFILGVGFALLMAGGVSLFMQDLDVTTITHWQWAVTIAGGVLLLFSAMRGTRQ